MEVTVMGLLYFVAEPLTDELLAAVGLPWWSARRCQQGECRQGPEGQRGTMFARPGAVPSVDLKTQTWKRTAGGRLWVGWPKDAPPGEAALRREQTVTGVPVKLRDGQTYTAVPPRCLPKVFGYDAPGNPCWVVADEYRAYSDFVDEILGRDILSMTQDEGLEILARALSINYELGLPQLGALGLVDTKTVETAVKALLDLVEVDAEKNAEVAAEGTPG